MRKYIVSEVPTVGPYANRNSEKTYYCHMAGHPDIPVFGSIGDRKKAKKVCDMMNMRNTR